MRISRYPARQAWLFAAFLGAVTSPLAARAQQENGEATAESEEQREELPVDVTDTSWRRPLASRNQIPLALLFVYMTPDRAGSLAPGHTELELRFDYSNIIIEHESERELLAFDLEYLRTVVTLKRGFSRNVELGVSLPLYMYYGGFLDSFVSAFHEAFDLPNFMRGQTPNGLVRYEYLNGGDAVFQGEDSFGAVGDVSLHFKKELFQNNRATFSVRSDLKLPAGSPRRLSGSGAADLGLGLAFDRIGDRLGIYANANYHLLGKPDSLPAKSFLSVMAGFDYRFKPRLALVVQMDHVRPFLEGELPIFDKGGQQIALGLRFRHSDRFAYEWRLVEDLSSLSPDFTFAFDMAIGWAGSAN